MAVTGVLNLTELISNQLLSDNQNALPVTQSGAPQNANIAPLIQDSFTPSNQNIVTTAQDAGLFQLSQLTASSAAGGVLSGQGATPQVAQDIAAVLATQTTNNNAVTPQVQPATTPEPQTPAPAQTAAPPQATTNASVLVSQAELQSLNGVLLGLGLSTTDIDYIDLIASVTKVYNPTLYTDLVQQYEAQAAQEKAAAAQVNQPATQSQAATA